MTHQTTSATAALLAPEIMVPDQFFSPRPALAESERRLRLAILEDALRACREYQDATERRARVLYADATDWIASPDRDEPFAFENVCDALGLDPHAIRRHVRSWEHDPPGARLPYTRARVYAASQVRGRSQSRHAA